MDEIRQTQAEVVTQAPVLPTSMLAITSLVAGILGYVGLPIIGAIVAIVTGYLARNETRAVPPTASGDGLATAGIILGWVQIGLLVLGICLVGLMLVLGFGLFAGSGWN